MDGQRDAGEEHDSTQTEEAKKLELTLHDFSANKLLGEQRTKMLT